MNSRRRFLTGSAATGAAALALSAFPPSIRRAIAIPAHNRTGTIMDVEHVVILMQENRSFDSYFGTLKGVRGFGDRFTIPLPGGLNVWQQLGDKGEQVLPYHLDQTKGNAQRVKGTPHTWPDAQNAWDGGRMNQWPRYKTAASMGYYSEAELPFQFALANAFTVCDAYHCSLHAGTTPNRIVHLTGTNGPGGETASGPAKIAAVDNRWESIFKKDDTGQFGYDWKTYPERLQDARVSWMVYQNLPDNYTNNPLAAFKPYRAAANRKDTAYDDGRKPAPGVAIPAYDPVFDEAYDPLYKGVANTMPDGGFLETFRRDIREGKLPQVAWIIPPKAYCEHPSPSSPVQGAWYIQQVLDALTSAPEVWSRTVLIVNFDENDGFFDHMPSPSAPSIDADGTPAGKTTLPEAAIALERNLHPLGAGEPAQTDGRVFGPGVRVPMYILSPWSRGGWVDSQVFDHTSVLRFLEARFGVKEPNISPFRRAVCGDLTSAFNFATPNTEKLPVLAGRTIKDEADRLRAAQEKLPQVPRPGDAGLPRQATGTRPSRALPYDLHAWALADAGGGTMQLRFGNSGGVAAVFHVYDRLNLARLPRRYMVEPDMTLDDTWNAMADNAGRYDLWVLGPNGFHRHFKGDLHTLRPHDAPRPEVRVRSDATSGRVLLEMRNDGGKACRFTIRPKAYRRDGPWVVPVAGGAASHKDWDLAGSGAWYDFAVTCDADPDYYRRFAGRVETGKDSISDPWMGRREF